MTRKKTAKGKEPTTVVVNDPADCKGTLRSIGGSQSDHWNNSLANQAVQALWLSNSDAAERDRQLSATVAALVGIAPKDELESMMATQLIAAHHATMECYRLAILNGQTFEVWRESLNQANKLSRTWATLLDALNKHRGKGQQKVTVEHVHVHSGGQAVVGNVERPGGGGWRQIGGTTPCKEKTSKPLPHAPEPPMWRQDPERDAVPVTPRWRMAVAGCTGASLPALRSVTPMPESTAAIRRTPLRSGGNWRHSSGPCAGLWRKLADRTEAETVPTVPSGSTCTREAQAQDLLSPKLNRIHRTRQSPGE